MNHIKTKFRSGLVVFGLLISFQGVAQVYEPQDPQDIPSYLYYNPTVNNNVNFIHNYTGVGIASLDSSMTIVQNPNDIEYFSSTKLEMFPNTELLPNDSNFVELRVKTPPIQLAWFEPSETIGVVGKHEKLELGMSLPDSINDLINNFIDDSISNFLNPYNPDDIDVHAFIDVLDSNGNWIYKREINCFYYREFIRDTLGGLQDLVKWDWVDQETPYNFRLRYAPQELGSHKISIYAHFGDSIVCQVNPVIINVVPSNNKGHIEVADNQRYLKYGETGESFFPIGGMLMHEESGKPFKDILDYKSADGSVINADSTKYWVDPYFKRRTFHPVCYTEYLKMMETYAEAGANYFREAGFAWYLDIEFEELNNYYDRMHHAWEFDRILDKAKDLDLKMEYAMQMQNHLDNPHTYGAYPWDWADSTNCGLDSFNEHDPIGYCYKDSLGLDEPIEFLTNNLAKENWKKKLRYFIARNGYSTELSILQFMNEPSQAGRDIAHEQKEFSWGTGCDNPSTSQGNEAPAPYGSDIRFRMAMGHWQHEMADYVKNELKHYHQLIGTANGGGHDYWIMNLTEWINELNFHPFMIDALNIEEIINEETENTHVLYGDYSVIDPLFDVNGWNQYSTDVRKYFKWIEESENLTEYIIEETGQSKNCYCGGSHTENHENYGDNLPTNYSFSTCKPFLFGEFGGGNYHSCDNDIQDIQSMLLSPFTGVSGMAPSWDNSGSHESDNWYLYGNVKKFLSDFDCANKMWMPQKDEIAFFSNGDGYDIGLLALTSTDSQRESFGAVNNRRWNYYHEDNSYWKYNYDDFGNLIDSVWTKCGDYTKLSDVSPVVSEELTYFHTSEENKVMILKENNSTLLYEITWINPLTMDTIKVDTVDTRYIGTYKSEEIILNIPALGLDNGNSPISYFHSKPINGGHSPIIGEQEIDSPNNFKIQVYPNPTKNDLNIKLLFSNELGVKFNIFNSLGELIMMSDIIKDDNIVINTGNWNSGMYYIQMFYKSKNIDNKTIIIKK